MANKKDFIASGPTKPDIAKSHFDLSFTNNLTANFGKIYPLGTWLMPAGSHFHCDCDYGFDLQPLVFPVQTNMRFHVKFYKAPLRILWKNWRNYVSRGGKGYDMPYISRDTNFYETGSLSDYMGVPSFQSTTSRKKIKSSFNSLDFTDFVFGVGDRFSYYSLSPDQYPTDQNADLNNLIFYSLSPFDFSKASTLLSSSFQILLKSNGTPVFNDTTYLYVFRKLNDANQYVTIKSFKLISSNCTISSNNYIRTLTISDSFFDDLPLDRMDNDNYFIGISGNLSSKIFTFLPDSIYVPEVLTTTQDNNLKYPSFVEQVRKYMPYTPFSVSYTYTQTSVENQATHFLSVNGASPKLPLLAFRWRMYEFIYNYFVRNERVTPFKLPDENNVMQQVFNQYLTNDGDGADSTTPIEFKFAPYEYDLFTTCLKKPTFGDAPLVGVSFTYDMSGDTPTGEFTLLKEGDANPSNYQVQLDGNGKLLGISHYNGDADSPDIHRLEELINFGISINDLRNVSAYQRYLERMTKAGTKYENIMYEFFGTNPPTGEEFPAYLGGYTDLIRTDKVLNQAQSAGNKLGEYAGNAYLRSKGGKRQIRTYCQEDCYIMAVGWFSVTPTYSQKLDKDFVYTNLLDFVNPQFAAVSPQPVYDFQIAPLEIDPNDDEALHHVFGYNRPFAEAVSRQDECHGLFRDNMQNFIMQRIFAGAPELGEDFLYMKPEDMTQIFAVTDTTDKIFGQIHFDVNATLPLPHMAIPRQI